jgi:hypothetical protein
MKIRLKQKWYLPFERIRRGERLAGYISVSQLGERLNLPHTRTYRLIYQGFIPEHAIIRDPIYLIRAEPELLVQLEAIITERGWKRKPATSVDEMS